MRRWVPVPRLDALGRRIERLGRRAECLGQEPPRLRDTGERRGEGEGALALVELVGEPPRLAGWEPIAEIRHREEGNAVRPLAQGATVDRWRRHRGFSCQILGRYGPPDGPILGAENVRCAQGDRAFRSSWGD